MKNLIYVIIIATLLAGCKKDMDVSEFERIIVGCWNTSETSIFFHCFDESNTWTTHRLSDGEKIGNYKYTVSSDGGNIRVTNNMGEWIITSYTKNSFQYKTRIEVTVHGGGGGYINVKLTRRK